MKAKVLVAFFDKKAKVKRNPGDTFAVTPARFNEITQKGRYIEAVAEPDKAAATTEEK